MWYLLTAIVAFLFGFALCALLSAGTQADKCNECRARMYRED